MWTIKWVEFGRDLNLDPWLQTFPTIHSNGMLISMPRGCHRLALLWFLNGQINRHLSHLVSKVLSETQPEQVVIAWEHGLNAFRARRHYLNHLGIPWEWSIALVTHNHYRTQHLMHNAVRSTLIFMINPPPFSLWHVLDTSNVSGVAFDHKMIRTSLWARFNTDCSEMTSLLFFQFPWRAALLLTPSFTIQFVIFARTVMVWNDC